MTKEDFLSTKRRKSPQTELALLAVSSDIADEAQDGTIFSPLMHAWVSYLADAIRSCQP